MSGGGDRPEEGRAAPAETAAAAAEVAGATPAAAQATIPLDLLAGRLQDELLQMVILTGEVQVAIGPALAHVPRLSPAMQQALQAIDRLHQTLEDTARLVGRIGAGVGPVPLPAEDLAGAIRLRHLSRKLLEDIDAPFALAEDHTGEIAWF